MNIDAITSSIVHEIRQPLTSIAANGSAGMRWLAKAPPDFDKVQVSLAHMVRDSHHASEVLESIRALFKSAGLETQPVDLNSIVLAALAVVQEEVKDRGVVTRTGLAELPFIQGHSGQLQEVMVNLIGNVRGACSSVQLRF